MCLHLYLLAKERKKEEKGKKEKGKNVAGDGMVFGIGNPGVETPG